MVLGLSVRKYEDTFGIKQRYIKYFQGFDVIFLYPGSNNLINLCDGFVLIGGDDINPKLYNEENKGSVDIDDEIDSWEMTIIRQALINRKPIMGICRGLQLLNVYFGGSLIQDFPNHRGDDHEIHLVTPYVLFPQKAMVNTFHHQVIDRLAEGFEVIYQATDGVIEMIHHKELPIVAVQFHPEMQPDSLISLKLIDLLYENIL